MKQALCLATAMALHLGIAESASAGTEPLVARDMLEVTVLALKGDRAKALEMLSKGNMLFRQGDVFVYCIDGRGRVLTHALPELVGRDFSALSDKTGKEFGAYMLINSREGQLGFTGYYLPTPGGFKEVYREDYFTRVGDLTCGAGYYTTKTE
jgi:signal transduction histidine kinase